MKLQMFPPSAPMEFLAMDILGPLTQIDKVNRFLLVVTDRFSKLTWDENRGGTVRGDSGLNFGLGI
jgi:hypothetical protein